MLGCTHNPVVASISLTASRPREIRVAVSANARPLFERLLPEFQRRTGIAPVASYAASGTIFAQIQNGAPFDIFFSADSEFLQRLDQAGLAEPGTLTIYAFGKLAVWTPTSSIVDPAHAGIAALQDPAVRRVAIANPELAPYGSAAVAALRGAGVYEAVRPKLVVAENVAQAAQFVQSAAADAGVIALSLALTPEMQAAGRFVEVPAGLYPPIEQAVVVLKRSTNKEDARLLLDYIRSNDGAGLLRRSGFGVPPGAAR